MNENVLRLPPTADQIEARLTLTRTYQLSFDSLLFAETTTDDQLRIFNQDTLSPAEIAGLAYTLIRHLQVTRRLFTEPSPHAYDAMLETLAVLGTYAINSVPEDTATWAPDEPMPGETLPW